MTSKQRIRKAVNNQMTDKLPKDFLATNYTMSKIKKELNLKTDEDILQHFDSDVRSFDLT